MPVGGSGNLQVVIAKEGSSTIKPGRTINRSADVDIVFVDTIQLYTFDRSRKSRRWTSKFI